MRKEPINNSDSRITRDDLNQRIHWLEIDEENLDEWERDELNSLRALRDSEPEATEFVHESHWLTWAQEQFDEDKTLQGLSEILRNNIDWQGVADDLSSAYSTIDFDGVNYYVIS